LLLFHGDAATTAVDDAAANYQSPSIIAAGADAHSVSILTTLINLSLALVCFKAPGLIEKAGLAKRGAVILAFLNLCAWVPLALAFFLSRLGIAPAWFALLWFINLVPGLLLSVQRDNWLSNIVPHGSLGRYLGQRLAIKSAFYLGAFCFLGYVLDSLGKENLAGFTVIFTVAIAVALADFIIFTFMSQKKTDSVSTPKAETVPFSLPEYFAELKEKKLDTFIIFTTFFYLTVGLSGPLYAVYMLTELHFSYLSYTVIISAEFLARVVSAPFWGRYADKAGNIRVLGIVSRIIPLVPICWLFCHNLGYLFFVQILSGTCWGAFDLCTQSYLFKVAPQPKKLRYIIYTRCLILFCTAMGGLLGAFCVNGIFPTFGSKILSIFWLSGISRALVVMYLMPRLVDLAVSYGQAPKPPEVNTEILHRVLAAKRGQFYRREKQAEYAVAQIQRMAKTAATDISQYSGSRKWAVPDKSRPPLPEPVPVVKPVDSARRLYQYREALAALTEIRPVVSHHEIKQNVARLKLCYGLERRPQVPAVRAEKIPALSHHGIEENVARLKARYGLDRQPEATLARAENRPVAPHQEPKIDAEKAKSPTGLYHDKIGWANYMRDALKAVLQDRQVQPVPVMVSSYSVAGVPGGMRGRDLPPNRFRVATR
jgi:hypothetical protein